MVNQHIVAIDLARTMGPGHSMIKQRLISALSSIQNIKTFIKALKEFTVKHLKITFNFS